MASSPPPPPPPALPSADDRPASDQAERLARLERLAQRRTEAGRPVTPSSTLTRTAKAHPAGAAPRARRRHPAQGARAAALGLSLMSTAGLAGLFALTSRSESPVSAAAIVSGPSQTTAQPPVGSSGSSSTSTGDGASGPEAAAAATVVDGGVATTKWGPVQVEATFAADGTLEDVVTLRTPNDRTKSVQINQRAVPRLTQEALTAQTANVETISGATYTSNGYRQSLQSAIDAARAAGLTAIA